MSVNSAKDWCSTPQTADDLDRSDQTPTLDDLADLVGELTDELDLGKTPRLSHLIKKVIQTTYLVEPALSVRQRRRRNGDTVEFRRYADGRSLAIIHRPDGSIGGVHPLGSWPTRMTDRFRSDLEYVRQLCNGLRLGMSEFFTLEQFNDAVERQLRKLKDRISGKDKTGSPTRRSMIDSARSPKCKAKPNNRRIRARPMTNKQNRVLELRDHGFTLAEIAKEMEQKHQSAACALLKRAKAKKHDLEADVRRERASGNSIRPNVSLDAREGGESDD